MNGAKPFVSIAGLIGAGKTTFAEKLAARLDVPVFYEPVSDNPYLADFYKDMAKYAYPMQTYLLCARSEQQFVIGNEANGGVQDRTLYEDRIFARVLYESGYMSERDWNTYETLFPLVEQSCYATPNVVVFLKVDPATALQRIQKRNRPCEKGITLEYLESLNAHYDWLLSEINKHSQVISVDWDSGEFDESVIDGVCSLIKSI